MTRAAWVALGLAGGFAVTDWIAVARGDKRLEYLAKPATLVALLAVALLLEPIDATLRGWWVVALACSLAGDVFLMLPRNLFVAGLASFLLGHLAYSAGFATSVALTSVALVGPSAGVVLGSAAVVVAALIVGHRLVMALREGGRRELIVPVVAYSTAITVMVLLALWTGSPWAIAGALLFYVSDSLIGWNRFVAPLAWAPVTIIVAYHLGQAGLVLFLVYG